MLLCRSRRWLKFCWTHTPGQWLGRSDLVQVKCCDYSSSCPTGLQIWSSENGWTGGTSSACGTATPRPPLRESALQCSCCSWTLCGKCCSSFHCPLSSMSGSCTCSTPTPAAPSMVSLPCRGCPCNHLSLCYLPPGTFLYDTPRERERHRGQTHSLWAHLAQPETARPLCNPLYDRNSSVLVLTVSHLTVVRCYVHLNDATL